MRSRLRGRRRSVDRGTCGPGIQPRKTLPPGCRRCKEKRKAPPGASISRDATGPRAVRDPEHVRKHLAREPGDPLVARRDGRCGPRREVYGRTPTMNDQGKSDRPAGPDEVAEQRRATGRGGDGGKRSGQRKPAPAKRAPDTEPGRRAQCAGAGTASSKTGQEAAVHGAPAPRLRLGSSAGGVLQSEERSRAGRGWRDVAALRRGGGGQPPRPRPNG